MRRLVRWSIALALAGCGLELAGVGRAPDAAPVDEGGASLPDSTLNDDASDAGNQDADACDPADANDPYHCGSCTRSCYGAPCVDAGCMPEIVFLGDAGGAGIAVDDTTIAFASFFSNSVRSIDKTTLDASLLATGEVTANVVVMRDGIVYWTNFFGGQLRACAAAGCAMTPTTLRANLNLPHDVLVDDAGITYTSFGGGRVEACTLPSCADASTIANAQTGAVALATQGDQVYWTAFEDGGAIGKIRSSLRDGGARFTHRADLKSPRGLAVDATQIFIADQENDRILKCPLVGSCASEPVFATADQPVWVAVDGAYVYWVEHAEAAAGKGALRRCPVGGCGASGPESLATGLTGPWRLAFDKTHVYWTNLYGTAPAVMRIAK